MRKNLDGTVVVLIAFHSLASVKPARNAIGLNNTTIMCTRSKPNISYAVENRYSEKSCFILKYGLSSKRHLPNSRIARGPKYKSSFHLPPPTINQKRAFKGATEVLRIFQASINRHHTQAMTSPPFPSSPALSAKTLKISSYEGRTKRIRFATISSKIGLRNARSTSSC